MKNTVKIFWAVLGFICTGLGAVGAVLPILPTVPFLLAAVFCFARSSERLHKWFVSTKLYRNNLEGFVKNRSMTKKVKCKIIGTVSILMLFGFLMMKQVPAARIVLAVVWLGHLIYFGIMVPTEKVVLMEKVVPEENVIPAEKEG